MIFLFFLVCRITAVGVCYLHRKIGYNLAKMWSKVEEFGKGIYLFKKDVKKGKQTSFITQNNVPSSSRNDISMQEALSSSSFLNMHIAAACLMVWFILSPHWIGWLERQQTFIVAVAASIYRYVWSINLLCSHAAGFKSLELPLKIIIIIPKAIWLFIMQVLSWEKRTQKWNAYGNG